MWSLVLQEWMKMLLNYFVRVSKPVFLVVNKVDNGKRAEDAVEFYALGLGDYYTIASINGSGTGELIRCIS